MSENPYQAPASEVADPSQIDPSGAGFSGEVHVREAAAGGRWLSDAWRLFSANPGLWIAFILVIIAISAAVQILGPFGGIAQSLITPVLSAGIMLGCDRVYRGGELKFDDLFAAFKEPHLVPLLILGAIYLVATIVIMLISIVPFLGSFFLLFDNKPLSAMDLLPMMLGLAVFGLLLVPLMAASWMAAPLVVINNQKPVDALKLSLVGCLKNWLPFLIYGLLLLPLSIAASLPLMLGWLVLAPVLMASAYTSYRDIYYSQGSTAA
ncbi:MAG: hypothetical protein KDI71_11210 [Xanthomonadales bacterium]|nr:hypothetical protein [Xanthomonadales bacterium]